MTGPTVLVTGAAGQVGRALLRLAEEAGVRAVGLDRTGLDVADGAAVDRSLAAHRPDAVVNAAAYTAVDKAEGEPDAAFRVNRDGPAALADACARAGLPLVHLSTDYVFSGRKGAPYTTVDTVDPLGVYGRSKAEGDEAVRQRLGRHVILRTAWVFSADGHNFVKTIVRLAGERDELRVVADQWGHPTPADGVARAALAAARRAVAGGSVWGTFHAAGAPLTTWHGLASAVVEAAAETDPRYRAHVVPIPTEAYPTPAARPARVELDLGSTETALGVAPPDWRPAVRRVVKDLLGADPGGGRGVD